jgi:hypothetical protein
LNKNLLQVVSGHNGKITQWKSTDFTFDMIFQTLKGNKNIDNFRIAIDATGSIMAVSCSDKIIRIRSTSDGSLLTKIPVAESISSLYFGIGNTYLIASSVEGYIYFYQLDLGNYVNAATISQQDDNTMKNKIKLFEKLMENDTNFSKMDKAQFLIDKIKKGEDLGIDEFRVLDSKYEIEHELLFNKDKVKSSEIINLKEGDDQQTEEEAENTSRGLYMTKSKIFEKNLKEVGNNDMFKRSMVTQTRTSFTDTYFKKNGLGGVLGGGIFKKAQQVEIKNINLDVEEIGKKYITSEVVVVKPKLADDKKQAEHDEMLEELKRVQQIDREMDKIREDRIETKREVKPILRDDIRITPEEREVKDEPIKDYVIPERPKVEDDIKVEHLDTPLDSVRDTEINDSERDAKPSEEQVKSNNYFSVAAVSQEKVKIPQQPKNKAEDDEFAINQLNEFISNTNKYVDDIGKKYTTEVNKQKEVPQDEYDYFDSDNIRLSLLNKVEPGVSQQSEPFNRLNNIPATKVDKVGLFDITEDIKLEDINETNNDYTTSRFDVSDTIMKKDKVFDINEKFGSTNILVDMSKDTFNLPTLPEFFKKTRFVDLIRTNCSDFSITGIRVPKKTVKEVIETVKGDLDSLSITELKEAKE